MHAVHLHKSSLKSHKQTLFLLIPAIVFFLVIFAYLLKFKYPRFSQIATTNEPNVLGTDEKLDNK